MIKIIVQILLFALIDSQSILAQPVPGKEENIPFLVTFGKQADKSHGDDDFSQTFFFKLPPGLKKPVYIRIFDPNVGGKHDEEIGTFNTKTTFSLYGGLGAYSNKSARSSDPKGNYKSGNLIMSKSFGSELTYDNKWYTFGPINPNEGEFIKELGGTLLKLIAEGVSGDDGNLYHYFLSTSPTINIPISGSNAFTFEYTIRLHDDPKEISHIYPYVNSEVISIQQSNFDWDSDGKIKLFSVSKLGANANVSNNGQWSSSTHLVTKKEKNSCIDIQFIKAKSQPYKNNNVVVYVTNQYGEFLPFYAVPLGFTPQVPISVERN